MGGSGVIHSSIGAAALTRLGRSGIEVAPHPTDPARLRYRPVRLAPEHGEALRM